MVIRKMRKTNNRGQMMLFGLMLMVFLFFAAIVLIDPLKQGIDIARGSLNCGSSNLTVGQSSTCLIVDAYLPYFIGTVLVAGAAYVFYRMQS